MQERRQLISLSYKVDMVRMSVLSFSRVSESIYIAMRIINASIEGLPNFEPSLFSLILSRVPLRGMRVGRNNCDNLVTLLSSHFQSKILFNRLT